MGGIRATLTGSRYGIRAETTTTGVPSMALVQIRRTMDTREARDVTFHAGTSLPYPEEDLAATPDDVVVVIDVAGAVDVDTVEPFRFAVPWSVAVTLAARVELAVQEATRLRMVIADGDEP